jgi:diguanylate cyclase (GGDEF)-like protein
LRRPAFLDLRRLEGRIVALFLGLLLIIQIGSFVLVQRSVEANAEASIDANLKTAGYMLQGLLVQRAAREHDAAVLLSADAGFRDAIGQMHLDAAGPQTLSDALGNHAQRVGAVVAAFVNLENQLVAAAGPEPRRFLNLAAGLSGEPPKEGDAQLVLVNEKAYQLVRVPVRAPGPLGAVVMGFALDEDLLADLKRLSNVDALLLVRGGEQPWRHPLGLLEPAQAATVLQQGARLSSSATRAMSLNWDGQMMRGRLVDLPAPGAAPGVQLSALLWASFDEAVKPYRKLQWTLLALTLAGVAAFAFGSVFTARRLSGPIGALARSAERLGRGDYDTPVKAPRNLGEVTELAQAFETMRAGIKAREAEVHRLAFWDSLTDLPNRAQFVQRLRERLLNQSTAPMAVLMLDLDRFKHVNDVLGHGVGDQLLQRVAERLQALAQGPHLLARLGGDEFALQLEGAEAPAALQLARQISKSFEQPLCIGDQTIDVGAGIGVALFPSHARDADTLMGHAELAMYAAKRGQLGVMLYDAKMDEGSQESLGLLTELRRAVEQDELRLFLQPKLDLHTREVHSAEALVRWQHPTRGLVPPGLFIPFAEQTGFVRQLTAWVLRQSARFAAQAAAAGTPLRISVNLSTRDLLDADLPDKVRALLASEQSDPSQLCLEITESAIMDDPQRALATTEQLHKMGFKLAIDDFGTGYSSLAYLKSLPVQELKIDQSFVMAMETQSGDRKIVRSTIDLAHNLGLSVVAEGIETATALSLLANWGCDEAQGYHLARPMPADQFLAWHANWRAPEFQSGSGPLTL